VIGDRWGVSAEEAERRYPCDELVHDPVLQAWRGVTVDAPVERVWPWVRQIRLGPYSYDWIDNLGRRSPQSLHPLADPVPGDPFTSALRGRPLGVVVSVTPGEQLTARIMGVVMSYVLVGLEPGDRTRLLLKVVAESLPGARATVPLLAIGDLVMARRQLLNLARLAQHNG
jgi:hypothetical protein